MNRSFGWIARASIGVTLLGGGLVLGGMVWGTVQRDARLDRSWTLPTHELPVPWPLTPDEAAALDSADPYEVARSRAQERGRHLVEARLGCTDCHGADLAGGTMIDAAPMGRIFGPNITPGGVTAGWTPVQWDHIVRHGVMSDGTTAIMPATDYAHLSDHELSDVIVYLQSVPASDAVIPAPTFGPIGTMLVATGRFRLSAEEIDHAAPPSAEPPETAPDAAFGAHLAFGCQGCHGASYRGGPIVGGDPAWPPTADLTALKDWTYEDFDAAVRRGERRGGGVVAAPMPWQTYANLTDVEVQALWAYFRSLSGVK